MLERAGDNVEGWRNATHATNSATRVGVCVSKIHLERVRDMPAHRGRMVARLVAADKWVTQDPDEVARLWVRLPEIYKSNFEKIISKNFTKFVDQGRKMTVRC
jgi:hypothetical protein